MRAYSELLRPRDENENCGHERNGTQTLQERLLSAIRVMIALRRISTCFWTAGES